MVTPPARSALPMLRRFITFLVVLLAAGGVFLWEEGRLTAVRNELRSARADLSTLEARIAAGDADASKRAPVWMQAVEKVARCGEWVRTGERALPEAGTLASLGLASALSDGYTAEDVCLDAGAGRVALVGVRTSFAPAETCGGGCVSRVFASTDAATGALQIARSERKLETLTVPGVKDCVIDGVEAGAAPGEDKVFFYCGTTPGDLLAWFRYDFKTGAISLVQEAADVASGNYFVREGAMLEKFNIRRRP